MKGFELRKLSPAFYEQYPESKYPEMEHKENRPYMVLLITIKTNRFALPFRTNIRHKYCYSFKNSSRDTQSITGIDYTKAVIINNDIYLGEPATIDDKEYLDISRKHYFIIKQFENYLDGYIDYIKHGGNEYKTKKYAYATLKYFHTELELE